MVYGDKIGILGATLTILGNIVTDATATEPLSKFKSEIEGLVAQINLNSTSQTITGTNFKVVIDTPITFDLIFKTDIRASTSLFQQSIFTKDQNGKIVEAKVKRDANATFYVSVIGQIFRAEFLKRLYNLIESSSQKTVLLGEVGAKLADLYNTVCLLGPVCDELYGVYDGGIYLYRDTISDNSDFFVALPYSSLPAGIKSDFEFVRANATSGLYTLSGYTPGMSSSIEDALKNRGALGKLDDNSKWLHVTETLAGSVIAPAAITNLIAYEAPRILAFVTLGRKVSMKNQEISLSALDANILSFLKSLRKIANKTDLVVLSTNELIHDVIELAPFLSTDVNIQTSFIKLYSKFVGVTTQVVNYTANASEAEKRLMRLAAGQWRYDFSKITGITSSANANVVSFKRTTDSVLLGTITYNGPFASDVALMEVGRSTALQTVVNVLSGVGALIDSSVLSRGWTISPSTNELTFTYTIDQLRESVAEILVDTSRSLYKRS